MFDDLSLNLENRDVLNDIPILNICVFDVIKQMSNEPTGMQNNNERIPILSTN